MCRDKENGGVVIVFIEFRRKGVIPLRTTANSQSRKASDSDRSKRCRSLCHEGGRSRYRLPRYLVRCLWSETWQRLLLGTHPEVY